MERTPRIRRRWAASPKSSALTPKPLPRPLASDELARATAEDFQFSRRLGVSGFPTVVVNDRQGYALLTVGFRPFEALQPHLEAWLKS